jgi:hypothetical protein
MKRFDYRKRTGRLGMSTRALNVRIALLVGAVVVLACTGIGFALLAPASGADIGMVTDPEQQIELPASKETDIQDIEGPATPPADDPAADDDPGDATPPDPVPAAITSDLDTNGEPAAPLPNSVLASPTNNYSSGDSSSSTDVYAGAMGNDPTTGVLIQIDTTYATGDGTTYVVQGPVEEGPLTLTYINGRTLGVDTATLHHGTYDLDTHQITWQQSCGGPNPCPNP